MRPSITALGFGMPNQIKNLYLALPDGLAAKDFMDGHGFTPNRSAVVQLRKRDLDAGYVVLFIHRNV